jgi:hypothetical protein
LGRATAGVTLYAGCHHDVEAPIDVDNHGVLFLNSSISYEDITDGRSHTLFLGELADPPGPDSWISGTRATLRNAGHRVNEWMTTPLPSSLTGSSLGAGGAYDVEEEPADAAEASGGESPPPPEEELLAVGGFGSEHAQGAHVALGDGSVRFVSDRIDDETLRRLAHRADGQLIEGF